MDEESHEKMYATIAELNKHVSIQGDFIVINVHYEYIIELTRCDSYEKILGWVHHLCEKTWMTTSLIEKFIEVAVKANNLDIRQP